MELSSSSLQHLTGVLMTQVLILGFFVYGGMYLLKRRTKRQLALVAGPQIAVARETVLKRDTKLDIPSRRQLRQALPGGDRAGPLP